MIPHVFNCVVMYVAVTGQHPLKIVVQEAGHRLRLFGP